MQMLLTFVEGLFRWIFKVSWYQGIYLHVSYVLVHIICICTCIYHMQMYMHMYLHAHIYIIYSFKELLLTHRSEVQRQEIMICTCTYHMHIVHAFCFVPSTQFHICGDFIQLELYSDVWLQLLLWMMLILRFC